MRISFIFYFLLISTALQAQKVISITNGNSYKPEEVPAFLQGLQRTNDFVITFRVRLRDKTPEKSNYFILAKAGEDLAAYSYVETSQKLKLIDLPKVSLLLVWDTFIQNKLFSIRSEKDIPNFCLEKYQIYNSHTYEFILLSSGVMKTLSFYDPEYYDNACYGMSERKNIINSVSVINYILNQ